MKRLAIVLVALACWFLIVGVVYEEALVGDRQFWLTRPYSRKSLLAAKLLFVATFINIPLLICDCYTLGALAFPVASNFGWLLLRQILVSIWLIWPVLGVATVTSGFAQLGSAILGIGLSFLILNWLPGEQLHSPAAAFFDDYLHRALLLAF